MYCISIQYYQTVKSGISFRPSRPAARLPPLRSARLLDQVRERIRNLHYSIRTEDAYVHWVRAFIFFHGRRHPVELGGPEVEAFLSERTWRYRRIGRLCRRCCSCIRRCWA